MLSAGGRHLLPDQARGGGQEAQLGVQGRDIAGGEGAPPARGVHRQAQGSGGQRIQGGSQRDGGPQEHQQDTGLDISIINCSLENIIFNLANISFALIRILTRSEGDESPETLRQILYDQ